MTNHEKRRNPRVGSHNLLSYVCLDEENETVRQGMGRTLNVSEGGILLETHDSIDPEHIISLTIGLEDEIIDIKGKITFHKRREDGKFEYGIQFIETDEEIHRFLKQYVVIFKGEIDNNM